MATPRFERQLGVEPAPPDRFAGAAGNELSQELEAFSSRRQAQLAQQVDEQSFTEGQNAAATGAEANASQFTVRGRAFNRGVIVAHQAAVQTDIRDSIGQFAIENPEDPDAFSARVEGLSQGLLKESDPQLHPFIRQRIADYAGATKLNIIEKQQARLREDSTKDLKRGAEGFFDDATTAAFEGNVPMIEARRQELNTLLTEGVAGTLISEGEATGLRKKFEHDVTQQEMVGNFDRLIRTRGIDAGNPAIDRWQATKPSDVGLSIEEHEAVTRQMFGLLNREQSQLSDEKAKRNAALAAELVTRKGRVDDAIAVLRNGFSPDKEQQKTIAEDLRWLQSTGDPADMARAREIAHDFDIAQSIQGAVHQFRRMPVAAQAQQLDQLEGSLRTGGASRGQLELRNALRATKTEVKTQLTNDPRGYVNREGLLEDAPLDLSSPEKFAASIQAREGGSEIGKQLTGQALPRLTAAEADRLAETYKGAQVEEKIALLGTITAGAGDDAVATLGQLDKKGNKSMALLGGMVMQGQGPLARDVLRGELVLAGEKAITPKPGDYQADIEAAWGSALGDSFNAEKRGLHAGAAISKYAELKARAGDLSDVYNPKLMNQALQEVLPTAEFNDRRVAIPYGVPEDAFEDWTDSWTADQFKGVAGADETGEGMLRLIKSRGRLVELGNGQYGIALESATSGRDKPLMDSTGKPFRLKFPVTP